MLVGQRKLLVCLLMLAGAVLMIVLKGDVPPGALSLMQTLFAAFIVGNAFEHWAGSKEEPSPPPADTSPALLASIEELKQQGSDTQHALSQTQETLLAFIRRAFSPPNNP